MENSSFLGLRQKSTHTTLLNLHHHSYQEQCCVPKNHMVQAGWRACVKMRGGKPSDSFGKSTTSLGNLLLWNILLVWEFPGERCFRFGKVWEWWDTWKEKWKWPETTETTSKQAGTGWWNRLATVLVRHGARKFNISKSYVHHILKKAGVKHYKYQKAPDTTPAQEQRQRTRLRKMSLRSRTCSAWIKPSKCPPCSPNWILWGSPEGRSLQGWLANRNGGSAEALDHSIPAEHGLGAPVQSRMKGLKTDIRKAADKSPQIFL